MVCYEGAQISDAISFIKENAILQRKDGEELTIHATGIGAHQYQGAFHRELNVR